jgi:hypothetical protein
MGIFHRERGHTVIDLRDHVVAAAAAAAPRRLGQPTRCPDCQGRCRLESIDVVHRVMTQRCLECGVEFDTSETELEAANARNG